MNKFTTLLLTSLASLSVNAKSWIDVTDQYVKNPRFDGNSYIYWSGTALGGYNPKENAEHYNKTFDTWQEIQGVPAGKYRVSLDAFYRMGSSDNDYNLYKSGNYKDQQYARLYAHSKDGGYNDVGIAPSSSGGVKESLGGQASGVGGDGGWWWSNYDYYIPNNMEAAYFWFEAGYYHNSVECEVGEDGMITIGIKKDQTIDQDWVCLDNWKLEYYGDVNEVTSITFDKSILSLDLGSTGYVTPIITPSDATYQTVTWTIKDTKIATVDKNGVVTATAVGKTVLTATATDGSNVSGSVTVEVIKNLPSSENIIINEIMASNVDVYLDPNQQFGSWVELYNPTDKSINIGGLYVSDDPNNLKKHKLISSYGSIPAKGYAMLNFDHHEVWTEMSYRQIDDKLDVNGGTIIVSDGSTIFAQADYPQAISRVSYARTADGADTWGYAGNPTPCAANVDCKFATEQLDAPVVDKDAQLFNGTMQICVNIPAGATLKYTTDGTAPSLTNGEVSETGLFEVNSTTTFRFRLFKEGFLPSMVITRSYIEDNNNYPFPIISVVTDKENIYGANRGAFNPGAYGRPGNGRTDKVNWNMAWEYPVNMEFINNDNECLISQECNFSMCGGWSRAFTPHSFKLKANKIYDSQNAFNAKFFDEKPSLKQKTLQIRNGGNDTGCRIKDAAIQRVISSSNLYVDYQAWQPVHVFLNGEHYTVLNMREPNNKHHGYANYGIDSDEIEQFEMSPDSGYVQMEGTGEYFEKWYDLSQNAADDAVYEEISKIVDLDEYINYMAVELYCGGTDWPQNNVKGYRDNNGGKFHFVLFDLDFIGGTTTPFSTFFGKENYNFDNLHGYDYSQNVSIEGTRRYGQIKFVTIFKNMLQNEDFRKRFIDAYCIVNGSVFTPERVETIITASANYLSMGGYINPWSSANSLINSFNTSRQSQMISQLKGQSYMNLSKVSAQTANITANTGKASIFLNDQIIPTGSLKGSVFAPVKLRTSGPANYKFLGWTSSSIGKETKQIFKTGEKWYYYDNGSLDGNNWTSSSFSTSSWKNGAAPLGYGKNEATTTTSNLVTYYFRKNFSLTDSPKETDKFTLNFTIDDGMIIYINGQEVGRYNMPEGNVTSETVAKTYANGNPDTGTMDIDPSVLRKGTNMIAVEVHNNQASSSDIVWDCSLELETESAPSTADYVSTDLEYTCPTSGSINLTAVWEEKTEEEMIAEGLNTAPVVINEISAANSVFVNDYFKKNDWVELYNASSNDVDIAGLYISDNTKKPTKYQIPETNVTLNTVIPAHGYKVIWCDKLDNLTEVIHTSFKLDADGGDLMIVKGTKDATKADIAEGKNIEYTDTVTYTLHGGQQSFGRYPDAGAMKYVLDKPTPGAQNIYTSYAVEYVAPEPVDPTPDAIAMVRDGGMTIAYVEGVVNVKSEDADITSVEVFSVSGTKTAAQMIRNTGSFATINVNGLSKGIYVAVATNASGDSCKVKFVIR